MTVKKGEVLVKKRGGASKRVRVTALHPMGGAWARVESMAASNSRNAQARQWWVPLGEDGYPEGYKPEMKP